MQVAGKGKGEIGGLLVWEKESIKETVERENIEGVLPGTGSIGYVKGKPSVTLFIM